MELFLIMFGQIIGLFMSIYTGVIVARYMSFDAAINRARSIIFNLDKEWEYRFLSETIPDPESPSGKRTVYMSSAVSGNHISMQLMEIGLEMKEMGHWDAAKELDRISMEIDELREDFLDTAQLTTAGASIDVMPNIADWHRRISGLEPSTAHIIKPWAGSRYRSLSCVDVNESTGEWREVDAKQPKTVFDDPQFKT